MKSMMTRVLSVLFVAGLAVYFYLDVPEPQRFDIIIENGTVFDGSGGTPRDADVGIVGDKIQAIV